MPSSGSQPDIFPLVLNNNTGPDKVILKKGLLDTGGIVASLTFDHMIKRLIMRDQGLARGWRYGYKSGDIAAGKYMPMGPGEILQFLQVEEVPPVLYLRGDTSLTLTLAIEIGL